MKRFFYILFISTTVFFSFGFRGCEWLFCSITGLLNVGITDLGGFRGYVGEDGVYYNEYIDCVFSTNSLSVYALNDIDIYEESNGDANKLGNSAMVIVGDIGTVFFSPDQGKNWEDRSIPGTTTNLNSFDFLDYGAGDIQVVVCGDDGVMYISSDSAGVWKWTQISTITKQNLTSMIAMTTDLFIAVGNSGTVIRTSDGGQTWENKSVQVNRHFNRIFNGMPVSAFGYAWAVGNNAYILATTDYGNSWFRQFPLTFDTSMVHIYDIAFRNQNEGILVGQGGLVNYTTNGGTTWLQDTYLNGLTSGDIISLATVDFNTGLAVVRNTTLDGGTSSSVFVVSSEPLSVDDNNNILPSEYSLEQNYPNPFNPSTKINYAIPQPGFVTIKVYDILGKEVASLVNEEKSAGKYEVSFDAGSLSSDIYFYQLKVGNEFVETKKLVLLK